MNECTFETTKLPAYITISVCSGIEEDSLMDWTRLTSIPAREMMVSCEESFYGYNISISMYSVYCTERIRTALTSAKFPHLAKCALKLAFELPPATPHNALNTPATLKTPTLSFPGAMGEKQSNTMAASLNTSAASRYVLHSGSIAVPARCAKRIVAILPEVSWRMCRRRAEVGEARTLPTPMPWRTERDERRPAIELVKAWRES